MAQQCRLLAILRALRVLTPARSAVRLNPRPSSCLNRGLRRFLDYTDYPTTLPNRYGLRTTCDLRATITPT